MISLLQTIVDQFVCWFVTGGVILVNLVMAALGAIAAAAVAVLPSMPSMPSVPTEVTDAFAFGAYWFPVGYLVTLCVTVAVLWVAWLVAAIPLRWVKATNQ